MINSVSHYGAEYLTRDRWLSYVEQVSLLKDMIPRRVAEVGIGPGVVGTMIESNYPGCQYFSVDLESSLSPDICASVTALPFQQGALDAIFCCQVLEHIPYNLFVPSLVELSRVVSRRVVISLPDESLFFYLRARGLRRIFPSLWKGISFPRPFPKQHDYDVHGQHFWEIGKRDFPIRRILDDIGVSGLRIKDRFRMVERPYWHFFVLEKYS